MILQALCEYYERKGGLAPEGFEFKEIPFIIVITEEGDFVRIEDTREENSAKSFCVIKSNGRSGTKILPNMLWDNLAYTLGYVKDVAKEDTKEIDKAIEREKSFKMLVNNLSEKYPYNKDFKALSLFYSHDISAIYNDPLWNEIEKKPTINVSFRINGRTNIIACDEDLKKEINVASEQIKGNEKICLISGVKSKCVLTTTATSIPGSQATAKLVSFQVNSGYDSYGKTKGENAPISEKAEAAYTTALKTLLSKDSHNKFYIGNRTFVFWTIPKETNERESEFEKMFASIFSTSNNDNPDENVNEVIKAFLSPKTGNEIKGSDDKFYILGLAPNAARISVDYWQEGTVAKLAHNISQHFEDLRIIKSVIDMGKPDTLLSLLISVTFKGSNIQPNLPEALMKSILQGTLYPVSLIQACLRRIKAEQTVTSRRAAILKAYINRKTRIYNINNTKQLTMALDKENSNQGYLCGRLFAVLDKIQDEGMKARTIKERFMTAAAATPAIVFSRILSLSNHHLEKIENKGRVVNFEKLKCEIIDKFTCDGIPARLSLDDQCRFFVGYYHQLQDFYTKK
ncbi:MAG: type I-C CRISPR-associated protein Cas8c/Csd1 [Muribaculaceae bacterium]|jgi:CRISPR-associated protein Csd1|nr:type I-C CRISPR-associated protein Cas8c/Csd1 [Muribaculaceae bacterium]